MDEPTKSCAQIRDGPATKLKLLKNRSGLEYSALSNDNKNRKRKWNVVKSEHTHKFQHKFQVIGPSIKALYVLYHIYDDIVPRSYIGISPLIESNILGQTAKRSHINKEFWGNGGSVAGVGLWARAKWGRGHRRTSGF